MFMVELPHKDGHKIWINPSQVISFKASDSDPKVTFIMLPDGRVEKIKGSPEDVVSLLGKVG